MYNIWGFLLQTTAVSIVAVIILLLKKIFEDKLSPRWQYLVWILLAIRVIVPVKLTHYIVPQLALLFEIVKGQCENVLKSNFSDAYTPISVQHILPMIVEPPQSVTDWLLVIYALGILVCLVRYLVSYIRLRFLLRHGLPVSSDLEQKMSQVCEKYELKPCKIISVEGFSSAFICGVIRPVLVVPYAKDVDEKVLLHELLHSKSYDTIQNMGWCLIRSLHWCNPLIHYVINRIENDMESLCDQRVLELLEGEERREYGAILLAMANQRYARIPGTTSISNGGKNISQRIAAIVRFKKYPKGMALVSICIVLVLFWPTIIGSAHTFDSNDYVQYDEKLEQSMAVARVNRCGTVAGALDTYVKGLYLQNGIYIASAASLTQHAEIEEMLKTYGCYQSGVFFGNIVQFHDYYIMNLDQIADKEYTATIVYYVNVQADEYLDVLLDELDIEQGMCSCNAYLCVPVSITYEDAWVVCEIGERSIFSELAYYEENPFTLFPKQYYGKNAEGEVLLQVETKYTIDNTIQTDNFWGWSEFDTSPKPNAKFDYYELSKYVKYTHFSDETPKSYVELLIKEKETNDYYKTDEVHFTMSDHNRKGWRIFKGSIGWEGFIEDVSGGGYGGYETEIIDMPSVYTVEMNIGGVEKSDIILKEVHN